MATIAQLIVELAVDGSRYAFEMQRSAGQTAQLTREVENGTSAMTRFESIAKRTAIAVVGVGSAVGALGLGVKMAAEMRQTEIAFGTMLGSAKTAKRTLSDLTQFAETTPFELPGIIKAAQQLLAVQTTQEQLVPTLRMLGDISAGTGKDMAELARIYGQVRSKGRLLNEEILQFAEAGIPLYQQLSRELRTTTAEIFEMSKNGQLNFGHLQAAFASMTAAGGQYAGLTAKQSQEVMGLFSTLRDSVNADLRAMGEQFLQTSRATEQLESAIQVADNLRGSFEAVGAAAGNIVSLALGSEFLGIGKALAYAYVGLRVFADAFGFLTKATLVYLGLSLIWHFRATVMMLAKTTIGAKALAFAFYAIVTAAKKAMVAIALFNAVLGKTVIGFIAKIIIALTAGALAVFGLKKAFDAFGIGATAEELQATADSMNAVQIATDNAAQAAKAWEAQLKRGEEITKDVRNVFEIWTDSMEEARDLYNAGAISAEVYARQVKKIHDEFNKDRPGMELVKQLQMQVKTFDMASHWGQVYEERMKGIESSVLALAEAEARQLDVLEAQKKAREEAKKQMEDRQRLTEQLRERFASPFEKYITDLQKINKSLLTQLERTRAIAKAREDFRKSLEDHFNAEGPRLLERGTRESVNAARQNDRGSKIDQFWKQQLEKEAQQIQILRKVEENTKHRPQPIISFPG